eukprot:gene8783-18164_t
MCKENKDMKTSNYAGNEKSKEYFEFGGPIGAVFLILWSHYILFYFWYCYETADGKFILPTSTDALTGHLQNFGVLFMTKCLPSTTTWIAYFAFFVLQIVLAAFMPGILIKGLPTGPAGVRLPYLCNGYLCYYFCLAVFIIVHYLKLFPGTHLADNYGEYLVASMVIADTTSIYWYYYGLYTTDPLNGKHQLSGNFIYDMFMGTILYPRIGIVDIKMVAEARWSWLTLFLLTVSCALKQYEIKGYISKEMWMMVLAHWLYSNATVKGEQYIPCTWDMFHERFGWMLNFWNICGVPFMYCFQSFYILRNDINLPIPMTIAIYTLLLTGYYIFDSANQQKASCKLRDIQRNTFPQVPWGILKNPKFLKTPKGDLLIDGWYAYARKMQYTGDIMMALSWGLICGFNSLLTYFYVLFFTCMIIHRQTRDEIRCKAKYGEYWEQYIAIVPNVFIPSSALFIWLLTGKKPHME